MRSVDVNGLDIDSHDLFFGSLIINGVDVVPLVNAELNRQFPGRELQTAQTPHGLLEAWVAVQTAWQTTVADTPRDEVDVNHNDEWSLAQTLRHLILATDAWLRGGILRMEQPFHEIGLIFGGADEIGFDMSIFRSDPRETVHGDRILGHSHSGIAGRGAREPVGTRCLASQRR